MSGARFTSADVLALAPCWVTYPAPGRDEATLRRLVGEGVTARAIAECEQLSLADRRWVLCHLLARGPRPDANALVRLACDVALSVVDQITDVTTHAAARQAIETAQRWSVGDATVEEVWRARDALRDRAAAAYAASAAAAADYAARAAAAYAADARRHLLDLAAILDGGGS